MNMRNDHLGEVEDRLKTILVRSLKCCEKENIFIYSLKESKSKRVYPFLSSSFCTSYISRQQKYYFFRNKFLERIFFNLIEHKSMIKMKYPNIDCGKFNNFR